MGYSAWPSSPGKYRAVLVIHANEGLNDYTRDLTRRLAKQGYVTLAVDYLCATAEPRKPIRMAKA